MDFPWLAELFQQPQRIASVRGPECTPTYTNPDDTSCAGETQNVPTGSITAAPTAQITCKVGQIAIIAFDSGSPNEMTCSSLASFFNFISFCVDFLDTPDNVTFVVLESLLPGTKVNCIRVYVMF